VLVIEFFFSPWLATVGSQSWQKVNSMNFRLAFRVVHVVYFTEVVVIINISNVN
jgi:hypothetical protein